MRRNHKNHIGSPCRPVFAFPFFFAFPCVLFYFNFYFKFSLIFYTLGVLLIQQLFNSRLLDMRSVIAYSVLRASLAIYHLMSNAHSWNNGWP